MTITFLYDDDSVLLERQGGATTAAYAYGNALVRKDGETPLFDGQGSERTVTNTGGAVQATLTLSAFGQAVASSGSSTSAYQYAATSRYRSDGDAGLSLVGCRYYDAQVGAFISRDTDLDQAPYAYCDADPVNATDPSGHARQPTVWQKILAVLGALGGMRIGQGEKIPDAPEPPVRTITLPGSGGDGGGGGGGSGGSNFSGGAAAGIIAVGIIVVAIVLAPETGGGSLVLLAA